MSLQSIPVPSSTYTRNPWNLNWNLHGQNMPEQFMGRSFEPQTWKIWPIKSYQNLRKAVPKKKQWNSTSGTVFCKKTKRNFNIFHSLPKSLQSTVGPQTDAAPGHCAAGRPRRSEKTAQNSASHGSPACSGLGKRFHVAIFSGDVVVDAWLGRCENASGGHFRHVVRCNDYRDVCHHVSLGDGVSEQK